MGVGCVVNPFKSDRGESGVTRARPPARKRREWTGHTHVEDREAMGIKLVFDLASNSFDFIKDIKFRKEIDTDNFFLTK